MTEPMDVAELRRLLDADRDAIGRLVREAWVRWARQQPDPKPSWIVPYDLLDEPDKEADRQIAEAVWASATDRVAMLLDRLVAAEARVREGDIVIQEASDLLARALGERDGERIHREAAEARVAELDASADVLASVIRAGIQRILALEAAARAAVDGVIRPPKKNGGVGQCAGCWSSWGKDSTEVQAWHYADCPVGALAALLDGDA